MNIVALQPTIEPYDVQLSPVLRRKKLAEHITACVEKTSENIELVVLPELCTLDYSDASFKRLAELAEEERGATFECFSFLAKTLRTAISFSIATCDDSAYYITNLVVDRTGDLISRYHKVHLAQLGASHEKEFFSGGRAFGAFELNGYRFGVLLCYDFRFPTYVQTLCQQFDIDVLLHPVAFCKDATYLSWHQFVAARAVENQVYLFSVNRAGQQWGRTIVCPPWVDEISIPRVLGEEQSCEVVHVSKAYLNEVRSSYPINRDRHDDYTMLDSP